MKLLENTKFTGAALIILLLMNTLLLGILVVKRPGRMMNRHEMRMPGGPPPPGPDMQDHGPGPSAFLVQELGFSPEQQQQFEALMYRHRDAVQHYELLIHATRDSLVHQLESEHPDSVLIARLSHNVGDYQSKIETATFDHFLAVRAICNDEQKEKFSSIIAEALRMMQPHGGPPMNGGPGMNGPPPPGNNGPAMNNNNPGMNGDRPFRNKSR
ncbi:MAG TPA: periplasmic heavy metal sensor [Bacteroidia bacterium]|nr:periplasmic heavy metal sensor [Bacteroidia bacterium]